MRKNVEKSTEGIADLAVITNSITKQTFQYTAWILKRMD